MGKLLFCSEGSDFEKINSLVTGFSVSSSGKGEFGQYSTYQKLRLPTTHAILHNLLLQNFVDKAHLQT